MPLVPLYGTWTYSNEHGENLAHLTCQDGYEINGFHGKTQDVLACKKGKWDTLMPRCTVRTCTPLSDPHGEWDGTFEQGRLIPAVDLARIANQMEHGGKRHLLVASQDHAQPGTLSALAFGLRADWEKKARLPVKQARIPFVQAVHPIQTM